MCIHTFTWCTCKRPATCRRSFAGTQMHAATSNNHQSQLAGSNTFLKRGFTWISYAIALLSPVDLRALQPWPLKHVQLLTYCFIYGTLSVMTNLSLFLSTCWWLPVLVCMFYFYTNWRNRCLLSQFVVLEEKHLFSEAKKGSWLCQGTPLPTRSLVDISLIAIAVVRSLMHAINIWLFVVRQWSLNMFLIVGLSSSIARDCFCC